MLRWAVIFLVIALVAALFGFTGIASAAAGVAKFLFFLFLVICLVLFIAGMSVAKKLEPLNETWAEARNTDLRSVRHTGL